MQKAVIFGCGDYGRNAFFDLRDRYNIVGFSDANPDLWGQKRGSGDILEPDSISSVLGADGVVIICDFRFAKIAPLLEQRGLNCSVYGLNRATDKLDVIPYSSSTGFDLSELYKTHYANKKPVLWELHGDLTWKCNLKCKYCFAFGEHSIKVERTNMSWNVVHALAAQLKDVETIGAFNLGSFGEPLMHPEWFEICDYLLRETTMHHFCITTNAMLLTEENVKKLSDLPCDILEIRISIDGESPEDLEFWRVNTHFETIKKNVIYAYENLDKNKTTFLLLNSIILPSEFLTEEKTVDDAWSYFQKSGEWLRKELPMLADKVHSRPVYGHFGKPIEGTGFKMFDDLRLLNFCDAPFDLVMVAPSGDILASLCSVEVEVMGNVLRDNIHDIWLTGEAINRKREGFKTGKTVCTGCIPSQGARHYLVAKLPENKPTLSVGMIVKNEASRLRECLNRFRPLLEQLDSELIIADTGSTDDTIAIAKEYTDNVFSIPWTNNFAEARNHTLRAAKGEWFMCLDPDHWYEDIPVLIDFFKSGEYRKYCSAGPYYRDYNPVDGTFGRSYHFPYIFKLTPQTHFTGAIYETANILPPTAYLPVTVLHMSIPNEETKKEKYKRNFEHVKKAHAEDPTHLGYIRAMALFHLEAGEREEAERFIGMGMTIMHNNEMHPYFDLFSGMKKKYLNISNEEGEIYV